MKSKYIKSFNVYESEQKQEAEEFNKLYESGNLNEAKSTPFNKVKKGDEAEDMYGNPWIIVGKGKAKDFVKYDEVGFADEEPNADSVIAHPAQDKNNVILWSYGDGGINVVEYKMKPGNKVKKGDIATDYGNEKWEVIEIVKLADAEDIENYDSSGWMGQSDFEEMTDGDEYLIAVKHKTFGTAVYSYGGHGAVVYESVNEYAERFVNEAKPISLRDWADKTDKDWKNRKDVITKGMKAGFKEVDLNRFMDAEEGMWPVDWADDTMSESLNERLRNINFIVGSSIPYDDRPFFIEFNSKPKDGDKIIKALEKNSATKGLTFEWKDGEFHEFILQINNPTTNGLAYVFQELDDAYGRDGAGMGWHSSVLESFNEALDLRLSAQIGEPVMFKGTKSILKQYVAPGQTAHIEWNDEYIEVKIKDLKPVKGFKYAKAFKEEINEARKVRVKRKYTDSHPEQDVNKRGPVRSKILGHIKENGGTISKGDLKEYIKLMNEDTGSKTTMRWVKRNARYLKETKSGYKLTKLGKRVLRATNVNEGQLYEVSRYKGRELSPAISADDFGNVVKNIKDIKLGQEYIIWEPGMNTWNGNYKCKDISRGDYTFEDQSDPIPSSINDMTFTKEELEEFIKGLDIYKQKGLNESEIINEGQFSWMTQDTNAQIGSMRENTIVVYMYDNMGNKWEEKKYQGYGEFGDKDYFELMAEMNGFTEADLSDPVVKKAVMAHSPKMRDIGIAVMYEKLKSKLKAIIYPALVSNKSYNWKRHDFSEAPADDPNQSWFQEEDEDEEYYDYH